MKFSWDDITSDFKFINTETDTLEIHTMKKGEVPDFLEKNPIYTKFPGDGVHTYRYHEFRNKETGEKEKHNLCDEEIFYFLKNNEHLEIVLPEQVNAPGISTRSSWSYVKGSRAENFKRTVLHPAIRGVYGQKAIAES